uniref:Uncharacterized protein n=1 Tax=Bos indicus x Bos taurus TaxID=30522 RepID=A0A4W2GK22_BOBOX
MCDRKAVIKNDDMSEEMQQDSVECATQALEKYNIEKDIAAHIKKECLFLGRKAMTKLDGILKSSDITLPTKVHLVKAMVFPIVM